MTDIKDWSATAASNNSASPDGYPEGMNPSGVNNSDRESMRAVRKQFLDSEWVNPGSTVTHVSVTQFTIADNSEITDFSSFYPVNRRLKLVGTTPFTLYASVTSVS